MGKWLSAAGLIIAAAGCQAAEDQAAAEVDNIIASYLNESPKDPVWSREGLSLYLPDNASVEQKEDEVYQISTEDREYLLYRNDLMEEVTAADPEYGQTGNEEPIVAEMEEQGEDRAFVIITPFNKDMYELKIGMNTTSMTTIMKLSEMEEQAGIMFDIVQSAEQTTEP
ncbi:hypothetical protein C6I21_09555 [Alkalicoccus urumqiensis]|uniref:DUF4367 domain-containing protein n=2 Tax=Alkalicoccus urumqiensis TaxID=1548213 RepID=A0A2P6MGJ8_ALKUR|nr:hypothetical protein C6I21_09555 [Alkalicoccus urumqiensis]